MYTYIPFKEEEIAPYPNQSLSESFMFRFNNFFCHFIVNGTGHSNGYRKPQYDESAEPHTLKYPDLTNNRDTRIKVNKFQFYSDLDAAVAESGNTNEKIRELIQSWQESKHSKESTELLFQALAPVYKGMRNKGYLVIHLWS